MIVAGRTNKPNALGIWPGQDDSGKYARRCVEFADEYGWTRGEVCTYWSQIALAAEFEGGRPRYVAEDLAWHLVVDSLRKFGEPD